MLLDRYLFQSNPSLVLVYIVNKLFISCDVDVFIFCLSSNLVPFNNFENYIIKTVDDLFISISLTKYHIIFVSKHMGTKCLKLDIIQLLLQI